jgi:hydroxymethylglutaryl-CoA lyase
MTASRDVLLRDVTLRDGLQLTGGVLPVERKVEIVRKLLALGIPAVEIGSMARPDLVPSMANTVEVIESLTAEELGRCWIWVATPRHVVTAAASGARRMQYCLSVSDSHNRANLGRTTERSMADLPEALAAAGSAGAELQLCLATSFTCPFEGPVPPDAVLRLIEDARTAGITEIVICDTLGQAVPEEVSALIRRVGIARPENPVVYHGHDTWGMGVANALAAAEAGAVMVDGALGGLGGCPFAPGASGNTSTEDLLFALRPGWLGTDQFTEVVKLGESVTGELGEPSRSKAAQGARSNADKYPWVIRP